MSDSIIKIISAIILAIVVFVNTIGNHIGVGDIIPTDPAETTTAVETTVPEETTVMDETTAAEFVAFFNAETAKIVNSGSYSLKRVSSFTNPVDVGGATGILNAIISAISENDNLDTVVGDLLGIGQFNAEIPGYDGYYSYYKLKATALNASDLTSFSEENGVYTFTLPAASNPKKDNSTAFSRFTNDFLTKEEIDDLLKPFASEANIKVNEFLTDYMNINVKVTVVEGKITEITYSYDFDVDVKLKAGITINGSCSTKTVGNYSNIVY